MKSIDVFKANGYNSEYEFVRKVQLGSAHNKVTFQDGARTYTRNAFSSDDGRTWVKFSGQYCVLDGNDNVERFVFGC